MRNRLLLPLALSALVAGLLVLPGAASAIKLPPGLKVPKVTQYPATIDAVGYLDYTWTYDSTASCNPGIAKTIDESLTFELGRPKPAKVSIINGKVILFPVSGGQSNVQTELSGWRTTNFCPPTDPVPEPKEPVCKKNLRSKILVGVSPTVEDLGDDPAPLARRTTISVVRSNPGPQISGCLDRRPEIVTERSKTNAWAVDPHLGIVGPLGATDWQFLKLGVGQTMRRTVQVSGGCGRASFGGAGASAIDPKIRSCVVKGKVVVTIKRTGRGFGT